MQGKVVVGILGKQPGLVWWEKLLTVDQLFKERSQSMRPLSVKYPRRFRFAHSWSAPLTTLQNAMA